MRQTFANPNGRGAHPAFIGRQAIVIGAGIAGLAAAGALSSYFEDVTVLERDGRFDATSARAGAAQGSHAHGLLVGGLAALSELYPGLGDDFFRAGAMPLRVNRDFREEFANRDPMPQRDFGHSGYTMARPLIESVLRHRAVHRPNISIRQSTEVLGIEAVQTLRRVTGVRCQNTTDDTTETIAADLVVDASGRGQLTGELLRSIGLPRPRETAIGIDLCYTSAVLPIPEDAPTDWRIVLTHPDAPQSTRRAVLIPIEGHRWMLTVAGRGAERPPAEWNALLDFLRGLSTPTIYNAVRRLKPTGRLARFLLPESVRRHFEILKVLPDGLLPIGDSICRFNPVYGQGMSVAAKEAVLLHNVLGAQAALPDPLSGLAHEFMAEAKSLIDTPWTMAAIPDLAYPDTRGDRPADLQRSLQFAGALSRLAARDEAVQRMLVEVWHMLKPRSILQDRELMQRVEEEMMAL
jgi:2-polyprenyl-6-methoxyphenol hydroxylase-like FAD-dependent oxidoreductase